LHIGLGCEYNVNHVICWARFLLNITNVNMAAYWILFRILGYHIAYDNEFKLTTRLPCMILCTGKLYYPDV
jgi:hypothetical protein